MAKADNENKPAAAPLAMVYDDDGRILSAPIPTEWLNEDAAVTAAARKRDAAVMAAARQRIDRYQAICDGQVPPRWADKPKPATKPPSTRRPIDRAKRAISKFFPDGTDELSIAVVTRRLASELAVENRRLGVKAFSEDTVARALGRR